MTKATIAGRAFATMFAGLVLVALGLSTQVREHDVDAAAASSPAPARTPVAPSPATNSSATDAAQAGLLYGRVITDDGSIYEGRLRFGGDEEAFWGHYFNGAKRGNPWAAHVPRERLKERLPIEIFGIEIADRERRMNLGRPFMARFGDIARIDARGRDLRVTLKSGTVVDLDRFGADDFADGVRVWDARRGIVDLGEWGIRTIEFLPAAHAEATPDRLHGTVHTAHGDFTGFVQWDREASAGQDELAGHTLEGEFSLRFAAIRAIARRYGRVLVSWNEFERVEFSPGGRGPSYSDFPTGRPLTGTVATRAGQRLAGRLVYDLDESETIETLDAPKDGVDYTIPFGLVASIVPAGREGGDAQHATVTLHSGEELPLEPAGDLGERNAGMLIFVAGDQRPEYVPWSDIEQVDFDRPPAMYPPSGLR